MTKRLRVLYWGRELLAVLIFLCVVLWFYYGIVLKRPVSHDSLEHILRTKELVVVTEAGLHGICHYNGSPIGFTYDMAEAFAEELGVNLRMVVADSPDEMACALLGGNAAIMAAGRPLLTPLHGDVLFSAPYLDVSSRILVHRDRQFISEAEQLSGDVYYYPPHPSLLNLPHTGPDQMPVIAVPFLSEGTPASLIADVSNKKIRAALVSDHIASIHRKYYPQTMATGTIGPVRTLRWGVHPKSRKLLIRINDFISKIRANGTLDVLISRYLSEKGTMDYVELMRFHRRLKTRLPKYKSLVQSAAAAHGFDWRMITAQMYQESHFNPRAISRSGARGLMQLLPFIAKSLGVTQIMDPKQNIKAGVTQLKDLYDFYDQAKGEDRLLISLAAYNVGIGHMRDAREIARQKGLDPNLWPSMYQVLPLLEQKKYYKRARYGYCRGSEPIAYVKRILMYYDILRYQGITYNDSETITACPDN